MLTYSLSKRITTYLLSFRRWFKSSVRVLRTPGSPESPRHFSSSSFKDIQSLLADETVSDESRSPIRPSIFHRYRIRLSPSLPSAADLHGGGIVLYVTSLSVVRKTYNDCNCVRSILQGYRVPIDERDLSMDSNFLEELQRFLRREQRVITLPKIFIGGRYVGGADEVKEMHESGELTAMIGRMMPFVDDVRVCDVCGGRGFVVCDECYGSNKIYGPYGFRECGTCNVNGLIRCITCRVRAPARHLIAAYG